MGGIRILCVHGAQELAQILSVTPGVLAEIAEARSAGAKESLQGILKGVSRGDQIDNAATSN
ncbi:MAG TPA: hypothetical protein DIC52_10730 [Candidatus Latescibacteria bacterium]|nr:hypothetical protein [Candidatus Latescibacterota bacterium]